MSDQDRPTSEGRDGAPGDGTAGDGRRRAFEGSLGSGQPGHRHRRRRAPGDPTTTGSIPIVRVGDSLPDPTIEYRTPTQPAGDASPYFEVRYRSTDVEGLSFTEPRRSPYADAPPTVVNPTPPQSPPLSGAVPPAAAPPAAAPVGNFDILDPEPQVAANEEITGPQQIVDSGPLYAAPTAPSPTAPATPDYSAADYSAADHSAYPEPAYPEPAYPEPAYSEPAHHQPEYGQSEYAAEGMDPGDGAAPEAAALAGPGVDDGDVVERAMPKPKRNRKVIVAIIALILVVVLVLAGVALKKFGVFDSSKDFGSSTGTGSTLIHVESDASVRDIGDELADAGVVGSRKAFVNAVGSGTVDAGYYKLPKELSAAAAVRMMQDGDHRVGKMVIPEGRQLDSKNGVDKKTVPGVFQLIADATAVQTDDKEYGVTVEELTKAASEDSADDLGIPSWAREGFAQLGHDHRRIEGLIASGSWENIDPAADAKTILHDMIVDSDKRFTAWGLGSHSENQMTPYQTLIIASLVEAEAKHPEDRGKVARVIYNRLRADQRLEMDSTVNYTAAITNIDVAGEAYKDENAWNTYHKKGLPITPIGAVGEDALQATLNPPKGDWMYFVTVDKDGTTLFSKTFEKHKQNREVACRNKFLTTGCE